MYYTILDQKENVLTRNRKWASLRSFFFRGRINTTCACNQQEYCSTPPPF